jgi:hypothetical protein
MTRDINMLRPEQKEPPSLIFQVYPWYGLKYYDKNIRKLVNSHRALWCPSTWFYAYMKNFDPISIFKFLLFVWQKKKKNILLLAFSKIYLYSSNRSFSNNKYNIWYI